MPPAAAREEQDMETITNLIKDTPIPKMVKVRQNFDKTCIPESDIPGIITRELDRPEIGGKIQPGQKIAITCGSRGINHNAVMARAIVDFVKSKGAEPYIVANVPPNCFIPRPNVGSAVIRLTRHQKPPVEVKDSGLMFRLIRASFNQRRKTLQNGLGNAPELPYTKEQIAAAIAEMGLTPTIRGEALSLAQFAQLSDILGEMK